MGRVIGEARNKLPAVACEGLFVPVPFQRLNAAASRVLGQSFCRAVTQGWRGHGPSVISDRSEDLSLLLLSPSFGCGCDAGSSAPCGARAEENRVCNGGSFS